VSLNVSQQPFHHQECCKGSDDRAEQDHAPVFLSNLVVPGGRKNFVNAGGQQRGNTEEKGKLRRRWPADAQGHSHQYGGARSRRARECHGQELAEGNDERNLPGNRRGKRFIFKPIFDSKNQDATDQCCQRNRHDGAFLES
jgi:hypothetical protein